MDPLRTLIWVKWRLFLSQLRSSRVLVGQLVLWIFGIVTFLLALVFGASIFVWLKGWAGSGALDLGPFALSIVVLMLLGALSLIWMTGALLPSRAGGTFDPANLLHYPLPLHRLFLLDLASELFKGMSVLLLPSIIALHLALPFAAGRPLWAILPLLETVLLLVFATRTLECLLTLLNRRGRSSTEGAMATLGIVVILGVVTLAEVAPRFQHVLLSSHSGWAVALRHTPLILISGMLTASLEGDLERYLTAGGILLGYIAATVWLCYWLWRRLALRGGGARKTGGRLEVMRRPWRLPRLGEVETAMLEKELKYLVRNPQVRILLFMPLLFPVLKLGRLMRPLPGGDSSASGVLEQLPVVAGAPAANYLEGVALAFAMAYLLLFFSVLFNNAFGLEGHGIKAWLLAPVEPVTILRAKNRALTGLMATQGLILLGVNQVIFRDLSLEAGVVAVLSFITGVAIMSGIGNLISIYFPRQCTYGKKLEASRWAVVLTFVEVPMTLAPVWLAFGLGVWLESLEVKYAVLLAGAGGARLLYEQVLLPRAAVELRIRQTMIVDTIIGGDE